MDLERIQVVWAPTTRRLATGYDFPYTHRGALIQYADSSRFLKRKSLEEIRFPKQRFAKVQAAIFVYGAAQHEPELQPAAQVDTDSNLLPLSSLPTDITFPNLKKDSPMEVRRLTARLHLNMGHPSSQELYAACWPTTGTCRPTCSKPPKHFVVRRVNDFDHLSQPNRHRRPSSWASLATNFKWTSSTSGPSTAPTWASWEWSIGPQDTTKPLRYGVGSQPTISSCSTALG